MSVQKALESVKATAQAVAFCMALFCLYQIKWLNDHSEVKVWEKGRRIGASWIEALYTVLQAARKRSEGGQNTYYLSYNKDMTRQFIKDYLWWAKALGVVCGDMVEIVSDWDKDVTIFRITFASGNVVEALPSESRSIRSKQGRVIIDEAAFVDDLEDLNKAAMALLMWGGQVVILSTHNGVENKFNELIGDIRAGKYPYSLHRVDFDEALAQGLFRAICRKKEQKWSQEAEDAFRASTIKFYGSAADEELFCIPARSGGVWLTGALIESCMRDDIPVLSWSPEIARAAFDSWALAGEVVTDGLAALSVITIREWLRSREFVDIPREAAALLVELWYRQNVEPLILNLDAQARHFIGGDFGRVGDLTVFWPLEETSTIAAHTPFTLELRDTPFRVQEQLLFRIGHAMPRFSGVALDARGIGMQLAESTRQEFGQDMVAQVMLTDGWYREHMPPVKSSLEDRTATLPKNANVKDDFRSIRIVNGVPRLPEKRTGGKGQQRHGDSAVAYALARFAMATLAQEEEWECETAGNWQSRNILQGF